MDLAEAVEVRPEVAEAVVVRGGRLLKLALALVLLDAESPRGTAHLVNIAATGAGQPI